MKQINYDASETLSKFHKSNKFVRGVMGPIGSGKSVAMCWELFKRMNEQEPDGDGIRRTRWVVIRNTYRELQDTTIKTWLDWFGPIGDYKKADNEHHIKLNDIESEILFRALDKPEDIKKLLSLEITGGWINEARKLPLSVIHAVTSRCGRYPSKREGGGASWSGIIMDTNPPDDAHWWYKIFEEDKPEGWELFKQPSGVSQHAENVANLPNGYYTTMMAGKPEEWLRVYRDGTYGFVLDGKAIWKDYAESLHLITEHKQPTKGLPIYIGIDFGRTPAAIFGQRDAVGRWYIFDEIITFNVGAIEFSKILKDKINSQYSGHEFSIWGDPAGDTMTQVDDQTPFKVLRANGINARPTYTNDPVIRIEAVSSQLRLIIDGSAAFKISPNCKVLRKGLAGGYHYRRVSVNAERYEDKPNKNEYSHPCDALQYLMLGAGEGRKIVSSNQFKEPIINKHWSVFD